MTGRGGLFRVRQGRVGLRARLRAGRAHARAGPGRVCRGGEGTDRAVFVVFFALVVAGARSLWRCGASPVSAQPRTDAPHARTRANPNETLPQDLLNELGNPGSISKDQFSGLIASLLAGPSNADEIIAAFKTFDRDGSGTVSVKELKNVLTSLGDRLSEAEVDELLKDAAVANGSVKYADFVRTVLSK